MKSSLSTKKGKDIVLMGMKHSGKTTLGEMLSRDLSRDFFDLDRLVEARVVSLQGRPLTVREIYRRRGKEAFQALESEALRELLEARSADTLRPGEAASPGAFGPGALIALGGGAIENRELMALLDGKALFVFLHDDEEVLFQRIAAGGIPPFLQGPDPRESFHQLYTKRTALYRKRADLVADLRGLSLDRALDLLRGLLQGA